MKEKEIVRFFYYEGKGICLVPCASVPVCLKPAQKRDSVLLEAIFPCVREKDSPHCFYAKNIFSPTPPPPVLSLCEKNEHAPLFKQIPYPLKSLSGDVSE